MKTVKYIVWACLMHAITTISLAQQVPSPKDHFGFSIGDDYQLANYTQTAAYFKKLAESPRVDLVDIGETEEGRRQYMLVISSPENMAKLDEYKSISTRLAYGEGLDDAMAKKLAKSGKAVVWIDGALHSTEMVGTHQLIEMAYLLASKTDEETMRILDDVIVLLTHANPDGQELVADWYMRNSDTKKRAMDIPRLYQKYIGHDNNRDFYMVNMKESENMSRQLFLEWMPQIMYNHHQSAPAGAVVAGPPYTDPFNYNIDALLMTGIDAVGASMINRLNVEDKPGFTRMKGSPFSTWYNGGLRTTTYFHNVIGLLTEIIGNPTPMEVPLVPERLMPNNNTPNPVTPQEWRFKQSIDYSISLNYAVLDYASRHREQVLFNMYKMAKNSIEKGRKDYWQLTPRNIDLITANYEADIKSKKAENQQETSYFGNRSQIPNSYYEGVFANPAKRDARGYIIPADQTDFPTAVKFVNALIKSGIFIHKATANFTVNGKTYPTGSYIVKTDQAFRPHIIDMFEPQDYPNDFAYPGGPPIRPYDVAGWTLAYQMGITFDRVLDAFDGPFERLPHGVLETPPAQPMPTGGRGYLLSAAVNNSYIVVNDLLKSGIDVYRVADPVEGMPAGSFFVAAKGVTMLKEAAAKLGVAPSAVSKAPTKIIRIKPSRIALFDSYGGSMPSGWVRWILEQYHFGFSLIFPQEIDEGNLNAKYDAILFIESGIPPYRTEDGSGRGFARRTPNADEIPAEYRHMLGNLTADKSIPQLKAFLEQGGRIVATGSSTALAYHLKLPVKSALVEVVGGKEIPLTGEKYYVPGSVLQVKVNPAVDAAWGMNASTDVFFNNSPVFHLKPAAGIQGIEPIAWFDSTAPLRSGWAWGQNYLADGVTAFKAPVGKGMLFAYGPQITYRAQPHGTFKLLFNALYQQ